MLYTDYCAAPQVLNHNLLLFKLHSYDLSGRTLNWLVSFLNIRKPRVIAHGQFSDWTPLRPETPKGSLLYPFLFALIVKNLPMKISTSCLVFADDVISYTKYMPQKTQTDFWKTSTLCNWSGEWKFLLSPTKCKSLTMNLRQRLIKTVYEIQNTPFEKVTKMFGLTIK